MYVLDTNIISGLRQGKPKPSPEVRAWAASMPASQLFLSAISILELGKGVLALERRAPPQGSALHVWLTGVRAAFAGRILPFTDNTATLCAAMHLPNPRSERDAMIAAPAPNDWFPNYVATYLERDVRQLLAVHDLGQFRRFVRMCAARSGQLLNLWG